MIGGTNRLKISHIIRRNYFKMVIVKPINMIKSSYFNGSDETIVFQKQNVWDIIFHRFESEGRLRLWEILTHAWK